MNVMKDPWLCPCLKGSSQSEGTKMWPKSMKFVWQVGDILTEGLIRIWGLQVSSWLSWAVPYAGSLLRAEWIMCSAADGGLLCLILFVRLMSESHDYRRQPSVWVRNRLRVCVDKTLKMIQNKSLQWEAKLLKKLCWSPKPGQTLRSLCRSFLFWRRRSDEKMWHDLFWENLTQTSKYRIGKSVLHESVSDDIHDAVLHKLWGTRQTLLTRHRWKCFTKHWERPGSAARCRFHVCHALWSTWRQQQSPWTHQQHHWGRPDQRTRLSCWIFITIFMYSKQAALTLSTVQTPIFVTVLSL